MKKTVAPLVAICALALLLPSCSTNVQGDDASPVFLTASWDLLPLNKNVADGTPLQVQTVTLRNILKTPATGATTFLDVRLDDYLVEWRRIDGGTAVPPSEVFGGNLTVPAGGQSTLSNYQFLSASALQRAPFDQLFPFNGGLDRETGKPEIRMAAIVTFRGHTLSGQPARGGGTFDMTFFFAAPAGKAK